MYNVDFYVHWREALFNTYQGTYCEESFRDPTPPAGADDDATAPIIGGDPPIPGGGTPAEWPLLPRGGGAGGEGNSAPSLEFLPE